MQISKRLLVGLGLAGLIAKDSLRVEPHASPLKVLPIEDSQK
jgi:hypothetical protein